MFGPAAGSRWSPYCSADVVPELTSRTSSHEGMHQQSRKAPKCAAFSTTPRRLSVPRKLCPFVVYEFGIDVDGQSIPEKVRVRSVVLDNPGPRRFSGALRAAPIGNFGKY